MEWIVNDATRRGQVVGVKLSMTDDAEMRRALLEDILSTAPADPVAAARRRRIADRYGLDPDDVPSWQVVEDVCVRSPSGRTVDFPLPEAADRKKIWENCLAGAPTRDLYRTDAPADIHKIITVPGKATIVHSRSP